MSGSSWSAAPGRERPVSRNLRLGCVRQEAARSGRSAIYLLIWQHRSHKPDCKVSP